ncbi:MAG: DUF3237 domain-containing protein [Pseudomonadales bacterium]|nr:DUF3237 domain-containing protein [Pseudomonadales bacterium]
MKLEPLMTMHADLKDPVAVGEGYHVNRAIYDVTGGWFEGDRLRGKVLPSGGDWIILDSDGAGHLDVRATLQTDDGANIYVQYYGVIVLNDKVSEALAAGDAPEFGDTYFVTQPRFETGDPRYTWLNRLMAVSEGRPLPGAVEYKVYEIAI